MYCCIQAHLDLLAASPGSGPFDDSFVNSLCVAEASAAGITNCFSNVDECTAFPQAHLCPDDAICRDNDGGYFC